MLATLKSLIHGMSRVHAKYLHGGTGHMGSQMEKPQTLLVSPPKRCQETKSFIQSKKCFQAAPPNREKFSLTSSPAQKRQHQQFLPSHYLSSMPMYVTRKACRTFIKRCRIQPTGDSMHIHKPVKVTLLP